MIFGPFGGVFQGNLGDDRTAYYLIISITSQAFFWTFRKKLKAKKTQAEKNSSKLYKKLKQIIRKLNISPTSINFFFPQKLII